MMTTGTQCGGEGDLMMTTGTQCVGEGYLSVMSDAVGGPSIQVVGWLIVEGIDSLDRIQNSL